MMRKMFSTRYLHAVIASASCFTLGALNAPAVILLDDTFADGSRGETSLPTESAVWVGTPGNAVTSVGSMAYTQSGSSQKLWTHFAADGSPVTLNVGDQLIATIEFTPRGALYDNSSRSFRFGLFNDPTDPQLASDTNSDSGGDGRWTDSTGYGVQLALSTGVSASTNPRVGKRTDLTNSSLMGSGGAWTFTNGGSDIVNSLDTLHTLTLSVNRVAVDQMEVTLAIADAGGVISTHTIVDDPNGAAGFGTNPIATDFDQLFFRFSNNATTADVLDFSRLRVEYISPSESAIKILYVQDSGLRDSATMANILVDQGHDVTILDLEGGDTVDTASNYAAAGFQLLVVDEGIGSGQVGANFANSPVPVVSSEAFLYRNPRTFFNSVTGGGGSYETAGAAVGANAPYGQVQGETAINITNPTHPLAAGLGAGNVDVFDPSIDRNIFVVPQEGTARHNGVITFISTSGAIAGITKVAEVPGGTPLASVFCVEPGEILSDGSTNLARWVHLPWNSSLDARVLQEPAFFLYEAAVAYALGLPEPTKIRDLNEPTVFADTNTVLSFSVDKTTAAGSAVATGGIALRVNGTDVSGDLVIADGGTTWDVTYSAGFAADEVYTVVASATAADGGTSARRTTLDTLDPLDFTVEAEDYNFTSNGVSGLFFDNPIFCTTIGGGVDGCYYDRLSEEGIDRHKGSTEYTPNPDVPDNIETYRWSDDPIGVARLETMDTYVSFDGAMLARTHRFPDYEVRNIVPDDWQNYTRTYPTGTYNVYLRMLSSGTNGTVQLDLVDDPTTNAPNLTTAGTFLSDGIGPQTVPLTDAGGNANIVVEFTNTTATTLRLTQQSPGLNMQGYFVLVPTEAAVNEPPVVTITAPADGLSVFEGQATPIEVTATDDGTITNVQFFANGSLFAEDDTAPYTAEFTAPALGAILTEYTIEAVASDDGSLTGSDSIGLQAVDPSYIFVSTAVGNGSDVEMREPDDPAAARNNAELNTRFNASDRNDAVGLRFDLTGYDLSTVEGIALNLTNYRNNGAREVAIYGVTQGAAGGSGAFTTETWSDTTVTTWGDLPGLLTTDGDIATMSIATNNLTLLVEEFAIVNRDKGTVETISSPALTSFVQSYTGSSSITFLMVAATTDGGQFRFASKEATALDGGAPAGAEGDFAPYLAFRLPTVTIDIDSVSVSGNQATLTWSGGSGPYTVQTNSPITGTWGNAQAPTTGTSATVNATSAEGYYRVAE